MWRLVTVAILLVGIGGFVALQVLKPKPAVRTPTKQLPLVEAVPVEFREGALTVSGNGLLEPRSEVTLGAEVSGRVISVSPALVAGGSFGVGDLLVRLDPEPFRATLAQAAADRRSALAALALAEQTLARTVDLIERKFLPRQTLDERVATRDQARAALARVEALEKQRRLDLERTEIRAPFRGRVRSRQVAVGDTVQPGKQLARIFADDLLEVAVSLTDRDMALIDDPWRTRTTGAKQPAGAGAAVIVNYGDTRYRWPARVDRVEAAVDSATRTFSVVVRVDDPRARGTPLTPGAGTAPPLVVGMYASVAITGRDVGRYVVLPRRALRDGGVVWLVGSDGALRIVPARVLRETDNEVAIAAEGIDEGLRAIVSEVKVVTPGMQVRVIGRKP